MNVNIKDYGARAGDAAINTKPVQDAIDACHAAGGGTVLCPAGEYVIGTIFLKSHINLVIEAGGVLRGSANPDDYVADAGIQEEGRGSKEFVSTAHLIIGYDIENVSITGHGRIDGNSSAFIPLEETKTKYKQGSYWRPAQMLYFCRCRNVSIESVSLLNAPYWTCFFHGCENVRAQGVFIKNSYWTPNGDGFDIDCCKNVLVTGCNIQTGDDSIALRAHTARLGPYAQPCENVAVSNCVLSSSCNAVRVGVGSGEIRNCVFDNIVVRETRTALHVQSRYSETLPPTTIRGIRFNNIMIDAMNPFVVNADRPIENLSFTNITALARGASYFGSRKEGCLKGVRLSHVDYSITGGSDNHASSSDMLMATSAFDYKPFHVPFGFLLRGVDDIVFDDVNVRAREVDGRWESIVSAHECKGIRMLNCVYGAGIVEDGKRYCRFEKCANVSRIQCVEEDVRGIVSSMVGE